MKKIEPQTQADKLNLARRWINEAARNALAFELYDLATVLTDCSRRLLTAQPHVEEMSQGNVQ